jgi:transcription antitermination factor NusG
VRPRHERVAALNLRMRGFEEFLPVYRSRRQWSDRIKEIDLQLFPGYVFCRFAYDARLAVRTTPGVIAIVGFGKEPCPVPETEIAAIQAVVASGFAAQPWPYLETGQRVRIEYGCLEGVEGIVVRDKDLCRVVVSVEILRRSVAVEIDRELVRPVREAPWKVLDHVFSETPQSHGHLPGHGR